MLIAFNMLYEKVMTGNIAMISKGYLVQVLNNTLAVFTEYISLCLFQLRRNNFVLLTNLLPLSFASNIYRCVFLSLPKVLSIYGYGNDSLLYLLFRHLVIIRLVIIKD